MFSLTRIVDPFQTCKKFIKEYSPQPLTQSRNAQDHPIGNKDDKTSEYEITIAKLQEALENELAQHNATKHELSQTEIEAENLLCILVT